MWATSAPIVIATPYREGLDVNFKQITLVVIVAPNVQEKWIKKKNYKYKRLLNASRVGIHIPE